MEIRIATPADAPEIQRIYAPYVQDTAITFDYEVPEAAEFERRIRHTLEEYPYLVATENGRVIGYAYAGPFRPRIAYKHTVEASIYVEKSCHGQGIGKCLYASIEQLLVKQHIYVMYACITTCDDASDPHLTDASVRFHTHMGFRLAGQFRQCGYKFGKWYNMIWMEKNLQERPVNPLPFLPFPEISVSLVISAP